MQVVVNFGMGTSRAYQRPAGEMTVSSCCLALLRSDPYFWNQHAPCEARVEYSFDRQCSAEGQ